MAKVFLLTFFIFISSVPTLFAQGSGENLNGAKHFFTKNIDYQLQAYYSMGGNAPLGIPREIRAIKKYNPGLQLGLEINGTKWLENNKDWGLRLGLAFENRGMKTEAEVRNYKTQVIQGNSKVKGYFTGTVNTKTSNSYVTVPVSAIYRLNEKWMLTGGLYVSANLDKGFTGYVSDGHLRENTPVGSKVTFEKDGRADYDFSKEVQTFQWGTKVGAEWQLNTHFKLFPRINYGFNGLMKKDFDALSFKLHNIFLDLGFVYIFNT